MFPVAVVSVSVASRGKGCSGCDVELLFFFVLNSFFFQRRRGAAVEGSGDPNNIAFFFFSAETPRIRHENVLASTTERNVRLAPICDARHSTGSIAGQRSTTMPESVRTSRTNSNQHTIHGYLHVLLYSSTVWAGARQQTYERVTFSHSLWDSESAFVRHARIGDPSHDDFVWTALPVRYGVRCFL